ncbi:MULTISPECIES: protealysin inhibitor emfourin [unclassified Streptomyces]|uniref:protealysin inhibitor emfourin n=1 Tax=unclassified Streptomyces TaxID=2593676 RepID=UPI0004C63EF0|nr:protealysin inhibitor emfourin [Streptomyces sp. NRRL F-5135]
MRIHVRRTGGFAGIERTAEVDTAPLPDTEAREWRALAERALADDGPGAGSGGAVPDGFSYEIAVDGRTVRCADPRLSEAQRALVSRVLKEGA